jgi:hypothetical protein
MTATAAKPQKRKGATFAIVSAAIGMAGISVCVVVGRALNRQRIGCKPYLQKTAS